ncbi:ketopantoate reductase family protein [Rhodovarius lipocyclicus]|uniref:ketopantoate reductase family protein n=1 Tax=Rhodovarius lipocyclicus TaxID=268410 RepID=UPI00135760A0|nr:ketopantoate reductase family protein [Rhodovarius lipocyclicus]
MRLLVVGAGATGGYFGGRLAQAGKDVTFLLRPKRAAQIREQGLTILATTGEFTVKPQVVTADQLRPEYDAILLTVKAFALEAALADLAPAVGPGTMVLPVLNGMRHLDVLSERFGAGAIPGSLCKVATTLDDQGRIKQLGPFHQLIYGERDGGITPRIQALDAFLQGATFTATLSTHIMRDMWEKWIMLATLGCVTCLMRGTIGEIEAAAGGVEFVNAVLEEILTIARLTGEAPGAAYVEETRKMLTTKGSGATSSMYRDLMGGLPIEADQIVGDLLKRARGAGIATPLLGAVYANLRVYQNRLEG